MADSGEVVAVNAVKFVRILPGPVELVWSCLTECNKLSNWYGEDGKIDGQPGGAVWLMGGHIRGVVTQWKLHQQLSYTWNVFEPGDSDSNYPESYLAMELQQKAAMVQLTLFHLPVPQPFLQQTKVGWHTFLDLVEAGVSGENPETREKIMQINAKVYGVDLANLAR